MIYLVCFAASSFSLHLCSRKKENFIKAILFIIAVAIPVVLATFRSLEIGIDVKFYINPYSQWAINSLNFSEYWSLIIDNSIEFGYALINYIGSVFGGGITGVFFLIELFIIIPVYLRILENKDLPVGIAAMIFLLTFYNMSLSIARQSIALAILFYAYKYVEKKQYKTFLALLIIAMLFHLSAILGMAYFFLDKLGEGKYWRTKHSVIVGFLLIAAVFYEQIFSAVILLIARGNSQKYLDAFLSNETGYISTWQVLFNLIFVITVFFNRSYLLRRNSYKRYLLIALFNFILYLLTLYNGNCFRYSLYFFVFVPMVIPLFRYCFNKKSRPLIDIFILILFLIYWTNFNIAIDSYGTMPYEIIKM